jgi:hypothetical protein
MRPACRAVTLLQAMVLLSSAAASSGLQTSSPKATLGWGFGPPGSTVTVPLSLATDGAWPVRSLISRVTFPADRTALLGIERAVALEAEEDVGLDWEVHTEGNNGVITLRIRTARAGESLPDGPLAHLTFRIDPELDAAAHTGEIVLRHAAEVSDRPSATAGEGRQIPAGDGRVLVESQDTSPPIIGCFFYMH